MSSPKLILTILIIIIAPNSSIVNLVYSADNYLYHAHYARSFKKNHISGVNLPSQILGLKIGDEELGNPFVCVLGHCVKGLLALGPESLEEFPDFWSVVDRKNEFSLY